MNHDTLLLLINARHITVATAALEFTLNMPFRTKIYNLISSLHSASVLHRSQKSTDA